MFHKQHCWSMICTVVANGIVTTITFGKIPYLWFVSISTYVIHDLCCIIIFININSALKCDISLGDHEIVNIHYLVMKGGRLGMHGQTNLLNRIAHTLWNNLSCHNCIIRLLRFSVFKTTLIRRQHMHCVYRFWNTEYGSTLRLTNHACMILI